MSGSIVRRVAAPAALVLVSAAAAAALAGGIGGVARDGAVVPAPAFDPAPTAGPQKAILAGGCFWGVQAVFQHLDGVTAVVAGYSGGTLKNPTYQDVITETTGHAESVLISYDPATVSFGRLLQVFFSVAHDPTELDRQGPDVGPSYRSNIFYTTAAQKAVAEAYIAQLDAAHVFGDPIVTRVDPFTAFYQAEDYHQDFLLRNPTYPYIVINDLPKVANFKRLMPSLYRDTPVTVFKESLSDGE